MFKNLFRKKINILYLITLFTIVFVGNDVYASSNNSQSDSTSGSIRETTNDSNNSNIIHHILNPDNNMDLLGIRITGSVTISLFENNSQQFGNYPIYRVLHNERREDGSENVEYFVMRENLSIGFWGRQNEETIIILEDNIITPNYNNNNSVRSSVNFYEGLFRFNLRGNIAEINNIHIYASSTVNLIATADNNRQISRLIGVGNNPGLNINGILNIILDESIITNMESNRAYPVIFGFNILDYGTISVKNDRRAIIYFLDDNYYISLNSNNIETNNIRYYIQNLNSDTPTVIEGSAVISQFDNSQIFTSTLSLLRSNYPRFNNHSLFRVIPDEETEDNDENTTVIYGFLATETLQLSLYGQENTETRIVVQDSIITSNQNNNIESSINFRDGIFRFELGSNIVEINNFGICGSSTVNLVATVNGEIGGIRGVGDNPELDIRRDSILNIDMDNIRESINNPLMSRLHMSNEARDRIILFSNVAGLIGYFDDNGDYFVLNSELPFTGWQLRQLSSMSAQLQFTSNSNSEASDLFDSGGRYSMYYVNENIEMVNNEHEGLDFMNGLDSEIRNYWISLIETFHNMDENERNRLDEYTTVILRATEGIIERNSNENTTPLAILAEDDHEEEWEENEDENNNENITVHAIIPNNTRNNSISDSVVIEEEEDEDDEELNILPSPVLNNNIDIIPTQHNNNPPNNMGIGGTFGGGSGF